MSRRSFGAAAGGADLDKGHGHLSIEKMQLVLDFDGGRGLLRKSALGAGRRRRLLYWKDPPAEPQEAAEQPTGEEAGAKVRSSSRRRLSDMHDRTPVCRRTTLMQNLSLL